MGKNKAKNNQQGRPSIPQPATTSPASSALKRLMVSATHIAPLVGEAPPEWSEDIVKGFLAKLSEDDQRQFGTFIDVFARLGTIARDASYEFRKKEVLLDEAHVSLQANGESLEAKRASFEEARSRFDSDSLKLEKERGEVLEIRGALLAAKQELAVREAEIRGGLVLEREGSLKMLQEQITILELQRDQLPGEIVARRQELLEAARQESTRLTVVAQQQSALLLQRETEVALKEVEIQRREEKACLEEEVIKARQRNLQESARLQAQDMIAEKTAVIAGQVKEVTRLRKVMGELQTELDGWQAVRHVLGDDPHRLLDENESLRAENRRLDRGMQEMLSSQSQDDAKELRTQRDALQQSLDTLRSEVFGLRQQEHQWQRSVTERENAETLRVVLEKHKALLGSAVQDLRAQVDELVDQGKDGIVFPELMRMDEELKLRVPTESAPLLSALVSDLQARIAYAEPGKQLYFSKEVLQLFVGGLAMSRLHIFQGISGTGKTSLATAFCAAIGATCKVVPVQAGWRDRADLIGHYNAFEKRYYEKDTLQALYRAQTEAERDKLHVVLLDEMNLSRPEQYFSEFLSAMEVSQDKRFITLMESRPAKGAPALLKEGRQIRLPSNVWFVGTANHDETTNAFADKTHDRAFVLELPKHGPVTEQIARPSNSVIWSFESLMEQFEAARKKHEGKVKKLMGIIDASRLTKILNDDFQLGWGNRLEQQMVRFMPVVLECGGTEAMAVDHMLASRMFREGKVIGRHDKRADDLRRVHDALNELWRDGKFGGVPSSCLEATERDIQRLESGR